MEIWKLSIELAGEVFVEELFQRKPNLEDLQKLFDYYAECDYHNLFLYEHETLKLIDNCTYKTSTCSYYLDPVEVRTVQKQKQNKVNCSVFPMASVEVEGMNEFVKLTVSGRSGEKQSVVLSDKSLSELLLMLEGYCGG